MALNTLRSLKLYKKMQRLIGVSSINPLSYQTLFSVVSFQKYLKLDFVTQFLRNGSTELQIFVYKFLGNFKLHENVRFLIIFTVLHEFSCPKRPLTSALKGLSLHLDFHDKMCNARIVLLTRGLN